MIIRQLPTIFTSGLIGISELRLKPKKTKDRSLHSHIVNQKAIHSV